ncbi:MAG: hypothetical protein IKE90_01680 [Bacilli bacterium]|nr:hypothetical protein [Bacilli bacterium]
MYNFDNIIKKYNYDEQFSNFLYKAYLELVNYYGNENIIYNAFLNTEIKSVKDIHEYLKENDMLEDMNIVTENDLKRSSGIYISKPVIAQINYKYKIIDTKRVVLVENFDINDTNKKTALIHELCHMVKSYENEYKIIGNFLINTSGIIERHYKLTSENGKIHKEIIREKGVGLEKGFTTVAEEYITRRMIDKNYQHSGYESVYILAKILINHINESIIKYLSLHKDKDILYDEITNYIEIEDLADIAYKLNLEMYSKLFKSKEIERIKKIIINIITQYKEILNNNQKKGRTR